MKEKEATCCLGCVIESLFLFLIILYTQNPPYKSTIHAIRQVILHEGYKGLFNGYVCTMTRDVPFAALYFSSYETFKYVFKYKVHIFTVQLLFLGSNPSF